LNQVGRKGHILRSSPYKIPYRLGTGHLGAKIFGCAGSKHADETSGLLSGLRQLTLPVVYEACLNVLTTPRRYQRTAIRFGFP
jgi:hypothetical protein